MSFFVLNSGRAGSRTIAQVLSQSPSVTCLHEPEPRLIAEATRFRYGELTREAVAATLRASRPAEIEGREYGETNNKLALIVPALAEAFPDARYVWLVRDGRATVASAVQRGWFTDDQLDDPTNDWHRWRPRPDRLGLVDESTFRSWSAVERVSWLWAYVNTTIQNDLGEHVQRERWTTLRLEDLNDELGRIVNFLGIAPENLVVTRANARRSRGNVSRDTETYESVNVVDRILDWRDWRDDELVAFERHGSGLMDELYPGWRRGDDTRQAEGTVGSDEPVVLKLRPDTATETRGLERIHGDLADLRMLRGELRMLALELKRSQADRRRLDEKLEARNADVQREVALHQRSKAALRLMRQQHRRVAERVTTTEEMRDELVRAVGDANDLQRRMAMLEERLSTTVEQLSAREAELRRVQREHALLRSSQSYRLGHAVVRTLKFPLTLVRRIARRSPSRRSGPASSDPAAQTEPRTRATQAAATSNRPPTTDEGPSALALIMGLDGARFDAAVATASAHAANRRVIIVTDSDRTDTLRAADVPFELLPVESGGEAWSRRVRELASAHGADQVLVSGDLARRVARGSTLPWDEL